MPRHLFTFPCPCCDKLIEVDTRSGKARAVHPEERRGGQTLDDLVERHKHDTERLDELFSSARDTEKSRQELLEQQLERAKEEARKNPDEKPRNIFDLD